MKDLLATNLQLSFMYILELYAVYMMELYWQVKFLANIYSKMLLVGF